MSKAAELAALIGSQTALSNRNLIINGAMQVWQRGTSQSSNNYSSVDRWTFYAGSGMSVSQSTDVPSEFKYSCSFGGTGDSSGLTTRLEGQDCARLVGKDITVSFYLKQTTGAGAGAIVVALLYADTLDNFGGTTYIGQPTVDTTSDWVRYEVTFTNLPAQAANGLALNFKTPSSSAVVFLITGVQLEVGETATPFEHRSFGDELARCQRYYEVVYQPSSTSSFVSYTHGSSQFNYWQYKVEKRAVPTIALGSGNSWANATASIFLGKSMAQLYHVSTAFYVSGSSGSVALTADAEL